MKPISKDIVEKTWKKTGGMSPGEAPRLVNLMEKQQPFVLAYLLGVGGDTLDQNERELLLYLGIVVWQIMSQGDTPLAKITADVLDKAEEVNMKMLEYLEGESEKDFIDIVEKLINNYPQPEVLKYIVEALMEEAEEESLIRDESRGIMLIYLKTVIDCFNAGTPKNSAARLAKGGGWDGKEEIII